MAYIHTDSKARLALLAGMILTGIDELHPYGTGLFTLWEWQSRIPLPFTTIDIYAMAATDEEEQQTTIMPAPQLK
jgi:hypothetical protein